MIDEDALSRSPSRVESGVGLRARLLRRVMIAAISLLFAYLASYLLLRGAGVLTLQEAFLNGLDDYGNWRQWHFVEYGLEPHSDSQSTAARVLRTVYLPWSEFEVLSRGLR